MGSDKMKWFNGEIVSSGSMTLRLRFVREHLSIGQFNDVELPTFSILTGINGAGKSHLLDAIMQGAVDISDTPLSSVVLFNYQNFRLQNEGSFSVMQMESDRKGLWRSFVKERRGQLSIKEYLKKAVAETLGEDTYIRLKGLSTRYQKPLLALGENEIPDAGTLDKLSSYRNSIERRIRENQHIGSDENRHALLGLARRISIGVHEIEEDDFVELLDLTSKDGVLPSQLGRVFSDYYSKYDANRYRAYRNSMGGESLVVLSEGEFRQRHGPKPWDVINDVLERFGTLPYRISNPEGLDRNDEFIAELQHQERPEIKPMFEHLSSGEKILMALVATVYKATSAKNWPKILLLDEVDASLHPSMMQNLMDVISDTFLSRGMSVILVSHSPTTISLAPEESVFVVNPSGPHRIEKKGKKEALSILTEGYAILDEGVAIFDQVSRSEIVILTEGRNVAYLKKLLELSGVQGVDVLEGISDRSGKTQLRSIFDFFARVPHETHVLVIWDPDATEFRSLEEQNRTTPYVLDRNLENRFATKGIENLFDEYLLKDYLKTVTDSQGKVLSISFDDSRKADFEKFILGRGQIDDFAKFLPLVETIRRLQSKLSFSGESQGESERS